MKRFCYHTHTHYCDGKGKPREFIERALALGMSDIGFSSHTPLPFENKWSMDGVRFEDYCQEIRTLAEEYRRQISVYLALELDYIPGRSFSFEEMCRKGKLDYTIGAIHLVAREGKAGLWFLDGPETNYQKGLEEVFDGDVQLAVKHYYDQVKAMVCTQRPDIVGHIDKVKMNNKGRFFSEEDPWYRQLVSETLELVARTGTIVEVNTRGIYKKKSDDLFPGTVVLEECKMRNIPVTVSADAHHPDELLGHFEETCEVLKAIGFKRICVLKDGKWGQEPL